MRFVDRSRALSTSDDEDRLCAPDDDIVELEVVDEEEEEEEEEVLVEDDDEVLVWLLGAVDGTQCDVGDVAALGVGVVHWVSRLSGMYGIGRKSSSMRGASRGIRGG